jgi:nicotinamide mononucleotide transporter
MQENAYFSSNRILEVIAVVFSIFYTVLITYENILCWPAAIIASIIFIYLVYAKRLIAETVLHVFYLLAAIYGWVMWGTSDGFEVNTYGVSTNILIIVGGILLIIPSGYLLKRFSSAALPYVDSFTTIFSFMATYMMAHMVLENWLYWIVIDSVSVFMYARRGLYIASGLFVIYTILAINGYFSWVHA